MFRKIIGQATSVYPYGTQTGLQLRYTSIAPISSVTSPARVVSKFGCTSWLIIYTEMDLNSRSAALEATALTTTPSPRMAVFRIQCVTHGRLINGVNYPVQSEFTIAYCLFFLSWFVVLNILCFVSLDLSEENGSIYYCHKCIKFSISLCPSSRAPLSVNLSFDTWVFNSASLL